MINRKYINIVISVMVMMSLFFGGNIQAGAQGQEAPKPDCGKLMDPKLHQGRIKPKDRQAAADCAAQLGIQVGVAAANAPLPTQGGVPDYFGPYPNWAFSPLPASQAPNVTIDVPPCTIDGTTCIQATAQATVDATGVVTGITMVNVGLGYVSTTPPNVFIDPPPSGGITATASATVNVDTTVTASLSLPNNGGSGYLAGGIKKFIEHLDGLNDYYGLTLATGKDCTYTNQFTGQPQTAKCYEIHLQQFPVQILPAGMPQTMIRGYVERLPDGSFGPQTYLGPTILAERDVPVRITFYNDLPKGNDGNLFIPVDTTYMGAGTGPAAPAGAMGTECQGMNKPTWCYTENRATIHLHGGTTPWISDGTPHQWITPVNENTQYPQGVSVRDVPDMNTCAANNDGCQTFFYSNEQSARLMFYHDHAYGITRLNVYAGEAAGYLLNDSNNAVRDPITPVYSYGIPLVIQDKTFVDANTVLTTDPTWNWGTGAPDANGIRPPVTGDLWYPHVYMPNQNPYDITGANGMGRWDYGPWFWPPFTNLQFGPTPNPYCQPTPGSDCSATPWEPPFMPATPNPSGVPEAFMDTMMVNGKTYPTLNVPAGKVRFRFLSAANDRFLNLSLWVADPSVTTPDGRTNTEVKMVPWNSSQNALAPFPTWWYDSSVPNRFDDRVGGVPDPATRGPAMIQIGTEGGFLPGATVIRNQPVNYVMNKRDITVGNVAQKALFLGPAERADVLVDFSKFAGKTLILYNDSPAPVPAADPRLDYFTGDPDQTATGGAPSTLPGYGPNTRTVMQIVVGSGADSSAPADYYDPAFVTSLSSQLASAFAASQDTVIVPQAAYNAVYNQTFPNNASQYVKIQDTSYTFDPIGPVGQITMGLKPKAIIEDFTRDYGRMNALLGNEIPNTNVTNQTSIPQGYIDPPVELLQATGKTTAIGDTTLQFGTLSDGTQIWKITHNGVDTHVIHTHMFVMQLVNRVGWDGAIRGPDANELGWKDTYRMNPLEDIIVAVRPIMLTNVPFKLPNSWRPLDVTQPLGSVLGFTNVNPLGNPVTVTNQVVNFGWEYVYHCHILGHEENDMMRPVPIAVPPQAPTMQSLSIANGGLNLKWVDNSLNETSWIIQRMNGTGTWATLATVNSTTEASTGSVITYNDKTYKSGTTYNYRVFAADVVGATQASYPNPAATGYQTLTANSIPLQVGPPAGVTTFLTLSQAAAAKSPVVLTWSYAPSGDQTGFTIQRATNATFTAGVQNFNVGNVTTFNDTSAKGGTTYYYQIRATNLLGSGAWSAAKSILVHQ